MMNSDLNKVLKTIYSDQILLININDVNRNNVADSLFYGIKCAALNFRTNSFENREPSTSNAKQQFYNLLDSENAIVFIFYEGKKYIL